MTEIERNENANGSSAQRGSTRYEASLRLSVAPMMDWTDAS